MGGLSKESLIQRLVDAGVGFNEYARTLFEHPDFVPGLKSERVALTQLSLSALQLNNPCAFSDITARASSLGLGLCPLFLGAFLRLETLDQPEGPYVTIASPRPENDDEYPIGFYIRNVDKVLWLRGYRAVGETEWPADNEFIFRKY